MAIQPDSAPTDVQVIAHPDIPELQAPSTNAALQLADALKGVSEDLGPALDQFAAHQSAVASAKAQRDAFLTSGKPFADAVRDGQIAPTQNPWYIKHYNENAAKLQTRQAVDSIIAQSQTWAERGDLTGNSYAQRLSAAIGEVGQQFTTKDGQLGFAEMAAPL